MDGIVTENIENGKTIITTPVSVAGDFEIVSEDKIISKKYAGLLYTVNTVSYKNLAIIYRIQ